MNRIRVIFIYVIVVSLSLNLFAEEDKKQESKKKDVWKKKFNTGVSLTQSAYSNWAKGGENSIAWTIRFDGEIGKICKNLEWDVTSLLTFGQVKAEKETPRTTIDKIDMDGSISWKFGPYVNPYFGAGILTQFSTGYDYKVSPAVPQSRFWDPAYITQSMGAKVKIKNIIDHKLGIGLKQTYTTEFNKYTDNPETGDIERYKFETGIQSTTKINAKFAERVKVLSKLEMFSSFENIDIIDLRWDTLVTAPLTKYIVLTLNVQVNYDKDVMDKTQIKELAGLGISYNLFD
ncbi:DUF3078 domain-containing protein [bacterium]|nr:DUF3078 domain-containing protein [bacterium]